MELSLLGLVVQAVGAGLLSLIFFYLSRGKGNRVLQAAGVGWLLLFVSLVLLAVLGAKGIPFSRQAYQYFKLLYLVALGVAAIRMDRDISLAKPLAVAAVAALPLCFLIVQESGTTLRFYGVHMGLLAVGWLVVAVFIFQSPRAGLGRGFSGMLAIVTSAAQFGTIVVLGVSKSQADGGAALLPYIGFVDVLLEMLFGIGLIIWAMEDTERRLAALHA